MVKRELEKFIFLNKHGTSRIKVTKHKHCHNLCNVKVRYIHTFYIDVYITFMDFVMQLGSIRLSKCMPCGSWSHLLLGGLRMERVRLLRCLFWVIG